MEQGIDAFWATLNTVGKIYWLVAIPSSVIFLLMLIMSLLGSDSDHDQDVDGDHSFGGYIFSFKTIISFLTAASWTGIASLSSQVMLWATVIISVSSGVVLMLIMAFLFYMLSKMQSSGTMNIENAIGATGDVYITVPAQKTGIGKVQVIVQGALRTLDAMTDEDIPLKTRTAIEVVGIVDQNILLVAPKL